MRVFLEEQPFDPWQTLVDFQIEELSERAGKFGATNVFVGTMRDFNEGDNVNGLYLEHYPGMTETSLSKLVIHAIEKFDLLDALVVHRVGQIDIAEPIVLVAVWSAHRKQSFEACRHIMEHLKSETPFWKRETLGNGDQRWVEKNTEG